MKQSNLMKTIEIRFSFLIDLKIKQLLKKTKTNKQTIS